MRYLLCIVELHAKVGTGQCLEHDALQFEHVLFLLEERRRYA